MKRLLCLCLLPALLCTGCGRMTEDLGTGLDAAEEILETLPTAEPEPLTEPEPEKLTGQSAEAPAEFDFNSITDEQAIDRLYSQKSNADYIPGYCAPLDCFTLYLPPKDADPVESLRRSEPNAEMELLEDTDLYAVCNFPSLEEAPRVVSKTISKDENDWMWYTGAIDEQTVLATFDLLTSDQKLLCRRFRDDPEIKCLSYDYIAVKDNGDGTAELGWYCYLIDREQHDAFPEWNQARTISLQGKEPAAPQQEVVYDIELTHDKTELLIGQDDIKVIVRAVPPAEYTPDGIALIDEETGTNVLWLVDDNDYKAHGDNIQGDGWYCNMLLPDIDFGTDPLVSEEMTWRLYAQFEQDGVLHRSETVTLTISEPFTKQELTDMALVDEVVEELISKDTWKQGSIEFRRETAVQLLEQLADNGLVIRESICADDDIVSYQHTCGVTSGIKLTPFDPMMN